MLVARSREDYCTIMQNLARNSEKSAVIVRSKLLATLRSHPVWDVDAQANTFRVRPLQRAI